jgi:hypothetical protein
MTAWGFNAAPMPCMETLFRPRRAPSSSSYSAAAVSLRPAIAAAVSLRPAIATPSQVMPTSQ